MIVLLFSLDKFNLLLHLIDKLSVYQVDDLMMGKEIGRQRKVSGRSKLV